MPVELSAASTNDDPIISDLFPFELSPFQSFAINAIQNGHHSLSCVPTGSGKTVPAIFAIDFFIKKKQRVIYTSPIKALSNQKFKEFSDKFPSHSFGLITGDIKINIGAEVLIMTAEILQYKLANKNRNIDFDIDFQNVGCIIHDEIHMINDSERGHVWENCITLTPPHIQMVLLSATLDKPSQFATWIEKVNPKKQVYYSIVSKRTVPLKHYGFCILPKNVSKSLSKNEPLKMEMEDITNKLVLLKNNQNPLDETKFHKFKKLKYLQDHERAQVSPLHVLEKTFEFLKQHDLFPAVCFVLSKTKLEKFAQELSVCLFPKDSTIPNTIEKECIKILRQKFNNFKEFLALPEYQRLITFLKKGIAIHHSSMIPIFRELVEILFEKGYIPVLFATETFSVGLNMPIRTTIFTDIHKYDGQRFRILKPFEFTQASGRAGRRGMDVEGNVIHLFNLYRSFQNVDFFEMMKGTPPALVSKFKLSWDLVLRNDDSFMDRLMYSDEINKEYQGLQIKYREKKQSIIDAKANFERKVPLSILDKYLILKNKKSKKKKFQMQQYIEEYPSILKELDFDENIQQQLHNLTLLESQITEIGFFFEKTIEKSRVWLKNEKFMEQAGNVTLLGKLALYLKEVPCLIFVKLLPQISELDLDELLQFLSCFTNIRSHEDYVVDLDSLGISRTFKKCLQSTINAIDDILVYEANNNLYTGENYSYHFELMEYIVAWKNSESEEECLTILGQLYLKKQVASGDFVKAILKIVNTANQMEQLATDCNNIELLAKLKKIPSCLMKFVATNQSLYL